MPRGSLASAGLPKAQLPLLPFGAPLHWDLGLWSSHMDWRCVFFDCSSFQEQMKSS